MSETHLPVLEHTIAQTNSWLKSLVEDEGMRDRHQAYSALRAVLHALRDRLTPEQAAHLAAQLPLLVRGIFYEGWQPGRTPVKDRHVDEFLAHVAEELPPQFPRDPATTARAVLSLLWVEIDPGETTKLIATMPLALRDLFPAVARF